MPLAVKSDRIILPSGLWSGYILAEDGRITALEKEPASLKGEMIDATGVYVSPGFIDLHTHGGGGHDFMDGDVRCITEAALTHMRHGTTTLYPTTVAGETEELYRFLRHFQEAKRNLSDGPCLGGVHLEGPYFNQVQAGAQDPRYIKDPDPIEYGKIIESGQGVIARWSIAPELPGALEMGDYLAKRGILPSIGHSDAKYNIMMKAFEHHYTLVTHLYCGMPTITRIDGYRHLGVPESAYLMDDMDVEVIADGCHLPPELLRLVYRIKGPNRIALVTDSMRAAGMPEGESILGSLQNGRKVIVEEGVAKLPDKKSFAGSVATADRLIRVMVKQAGIGIVDAIKMMTATPARIMGISQRKGSIMPGMDCDLVIFDDNIEIAAVLISGKTRYSIF